MNNNNQIVVVNYEPNYAKTVAHMWNESRAGWGGHGDIRTEEQVRMEEDNSTNIKTYIALHNEEAVGYCGLSEYREDEGALYVPLLNVRTDFHGKKVGKELLLTALEETMKRGWPRLDLNTWPGNTKAVPLYKKCGFFWENRDDSVHLMNFMPTVLRTEAFTDFFQKADWYSDSIREIEVEPDGEKVGNFEIYEYKWKKDDSFLHVQIEKTGRGICTVKTDQYSIKMELESHKIVFGKAYPVRFTVENFTKEPLHVSVVGENNKSIQFELSNESVVEKEGTIDGSFLASTADDQSTKKTHPSVVATVSINGKSIPFKMGVLPMVPVKCVGKIPGTFSSLNSKQTAYIELTNNCTSDVKVRFNLPSHEDVAFESLEWELQLKPEERHTVPLSYVLHRSVFYHELVRVEVLLDGEETVHYTEPISIPFNTIGSRLYGECREYYHLFSGLTHVALKKENNELFYERGRQNKSDYYFYYPKLGKPFSEEYSMMKPESVEFYDTDRVGMKLCYPSRDFPALTLSRVIELTGEGLMSQEYIVENNSDVSVSDVHLNESLRYSLADTYIPYDDSVIHNQGTLNSEVNVWEEKKISENWFFSHADDAKTALIWEGKASIHFHHWHIHFFEYQWETMEPSTYVRSNKLWFGQNVFSTVEEVREFAKQKEIVSIVDIEEPLSLQMKQGSPILEKDGTIRFQRKTQKNVEVDLVVCTDRQEEIESLVMPESENWSTWDVPVSVEKEITPVYVKGNLSAQKIEKRMLLYRTSGSHVETKVEEVEGHQSYELNNGVISIKTAPSFFPGFYSLRDKETEWLATSFPTAKPKGWWNPWVGGLSFGISYLLQRKMIALPSQVKFVTVTDQFEDKWTGIEISTTVNDHPKYEGLIFHQFAVTRPGLPVLAVFTGIEQNIGHHFYGTTQHTYVNLAEGSKRGDVTLSFEDNTVPMLQHHDHETEMFGLKDILVERAGIANKLHFIPSAEMEDVTAYMSQHVIWGIGEQLLSTKTGEFELTAPHFLIFSKEAYSLDDYKELRGLKFNVREDG
ncbi:GNAT family N-acetyltransferase [Evansella sp. AB-rgal1]|uniref:GNAT family N-acetyltransferase n=1 Tax=Evansella sp. AB-rgal1 TaxID=3242696 RepID=UPI00359DE1B1